MRTWRLDVDTIRVEGVIDTPRAVTKGLEISFDVERSIEHAPNTCKLRVWNLNRDQRRALAALSVRGQRPGKIRTELTIGSGDQSFLLFKGDLRWAVSEQDGGDWETQIEGDDGGRAHVDARINRSFPPGTRVDQVVRACADALGLGLGNLPPFLTGLRAYDEGTAVSGRASDALRGVLAGIGLTYSVQHGVVQAQRGGAPLALPIVLLKPGAGLIGSPSLTPEGRVAAIALLRPGLDPGARVQLESAEVPRGTYAIRRMRAEGDASSTPWYAHLELTS